MLNRSSFQDDDKLLKTSDCSLKSLPPKKYNRTQGFYENINIQE